MISRSSSNVYYMESMQPNKIDYFLQLFKF